MVKLTNNILEARSAALSGARLELVQKFIFTRSILQQAKTCASCIRACLKKYVNGMNEASRQELAKHVKYLNRLKGKDWNPFTMDTLEHDLLHKEALALATIRIIQQPEWYYGDDGWFFKMAYALAAVPVLPTKAVDNASKADDYSTVIDIASKATEAPPKAIGAPTKTDMRQVSGESQKSNDSQESKGTTTTTASKLTTTSISTAPSIVGAFTVDPLKDLKTDRPKTAAAPTKKPQPLGPKVKPISYLPGFGFGSYQLAHHIAILARAQVLAPTKQWNAETMARQRQGLWEMFDLRSPWMITQCTCSENITLSDLQREGLITGVHHKQLGKIAKLEKMVDRVLQGRINKELGEHAVRPSVSDMYVPGDQLAHGRKFSEKVCEDRWTDEEVLGAVNEMFGNEELKAKRVKEVQAKLAKVAK